MRKQEQSRLAEVAAEKSHYEVIQAQIDIVSDKLSCTHVFSMFAVLIGFLFNVSVLQFMWWWIDVLKGIMFFVSWFLLRSKYVFGVNC